MDGAWAVLRCGELAMQINDTVAIPYAMGNEVLGYEDLPHTLESSPTPNKPKHKIPTTFFNRYLWSEHQDVDAAAKHLVDGMCRGLIPNNANRDDLYSLKLSKVQYFHL